MFIRARISLTAGLNSISSEVFVLKERDNPVWSLGAGVVAPLFLGGQLQAQQDIRNWYYTLAETQRTPRSLQEKALESMHHALDALDTHGTPEDVLHYAAFVLSTATRVARAAREGDLFGVGGELISKGERHFIQELESLAEARQKK